MKDENAIQLKRAYWQGAFDASASLEKSKSEKEKFTAEVWLTALDWALGKEKESASEVEIGKKGKS